MSLIDDVHGLLNVVCQACSTVHLLINGLGKCLGDRFRTRGAGVGVVLGVKGVDGAVPELAVHVADGLVVVDKGDPGIVQGAGSSLLISDEPTGRALPSARLPLVVRGLGAENDGGALVDHEASGLDDVEHEGIDRLARLVGDAGLRAGTGAVGAAVVVGRGRAAVVVSELDDDDVPGLDEIGHLLEAALGSEGAGRSPADSAVDDGERQVLADVATPAVCQAVIGAFRCHGAVSAEVDSLSCGKLQGCEESDRELHGEE